MCGCRAIPQDEGGFVNTKRWMQLLLEAGWWIIQCSWLPWRWIKQTWMQNQFPFFPKVSSETEWEQETSPFVSLIGQFPQRPAARRGKRVPKPDGRGSQGQEETAWGTNSSLFSPQPYSPQIRAFPSICLLCFRPKNPDHKVRLGASEPLLYASQ